MEGGCTVYIA